MGLRDHFHPPLSLARHWESFHARWADAIADALNRDLPPEFYFAEAHVHVGSRMEIDIATFENDTSRGMSDISGGTATLRVRPYAPPAAAFVIPATFSDSIEVNIYNSEGGPMLVSAVELVSPANKDRSDARRAFAAKCYALLQRGIGLMIVDVVTTRHANLHNDLVGLMETGEQFLISPEPLYATAYRPARRSSNNDQIEVWHNALALGGPLPTLPLALDKSQIIPLDLEATYVEACQRSRLS